MPVDCNEILFPGFAFPESDQGTGQINGVEIKSLKKFLAEDGEFQELLRHDDAFYGAGKPFDKFAQSNFSITLPGMIKGFHVHAQQDDAWFLSSGQIKVALCDLRKESPTFGKKQTIILGANLPQLLIIPRGVAHGFKVLGSEKANLFYFVSATYNPQDEGRIAWDHPKIAFDWETHWD